MTPDSGLPPTMVRSLTCLCSLHRPRAQPAQTRTQKVGRVVSRAPLCDQGPQASPAEKQHSQLDSAHAGSSLTQRPPSGLHGTTCAAPSCEGPTYSPRDTCHFLPRNSPHDLGKVLPEDTPGRALGECVRQTRPYDIPSNHSPSKYKESLNAWFRFLSIKPFRHHHHHGNENCYRRKALPPTLETRGQTGQTERGFRGRAKPQTPVYRASSLHI